MTCLLKVLTTPRGSFFPQHLSIDFHGRVERSRGEFSVLRYPGVGRRCRKSTTQGVRAKTCYLLAVEPWNLLPRLKSSFLRLRPTVLARPSPHVFPRKQNADVIRTEDCHTEQGWAAETGVVKNNRLAEPPGLSPCHSQGSTYDGPMIEPTPIRCIIEYARG